MIIVAITADGKRRVYYKPEDVPETAIIKIYMDLHNK
jgi:hypothetical protein